MFPFYVPVSPYSEVSTHGDVLATMGLQAAWGDIPVAQLRIAPDDPLLTRFAWDTEVDYVPATGLTGLLSPMAALGPHHPRSM